MKKNVAQKRKASYRYKSETQFEDGKFDVHFDDGTFIVFDIETTGGNPTKNGITEICALKYSQGKIKDTFYSLVNPRIPIPRIVQKMTGITNQTVRKAPLIEDVFPDFLDFIGNEILVSHNTVGDMTFLVHFAKKVSKHNLRNFFLCTHLLAEKTIHDAPNYSLSGLGDYLRLASGGKSHRAEADARMTLQLFLEIKKRLLKKGIDFIKDALRYQGHVDTGVRLGLALDQKSFGRATESTGVMALYDHREQLIFAGSSLNIRRDLQSLANLEDLPRRFLRIVLSAYHFHSFQKPNLFSAMIKEGELYTQNKFALDPVRWHGRSLSFLYVLEEKDGSLQVGIGPFPHTVLPILFVFGHLKDVKTTQNKLKSLAEILECNYEKRVLYIPVRKNRLIKFLFEKTLDKELEKLRRERFKFKNLLSLKKQRKLSSQIQEVQQLSKLDILEDFLDVSSINGILSVPHDDTRCELYPIVHSYVMKAQFFEGKPKASEREEIFAKSLKNFHVRPEESEWDVYKTNAMLWMISVGVKKKHLNCRFYPIEPAAEKGMKDERRHKNHRGS